MYNRRFGEELIPGLSMEQLSGMEAVLECAELVAALYAVDEDPALPTPPEEERFDSDDA